MKTCETCGVQLPDDYVNLLCDTHYKTYVAEIERIKAIEDEERMKCKEEVKNVPSASQVAKTGAINGITDPNYTENPQAEDKEQYEANIGLFQKNGILLWKPTRLMYSYIRDWCREKTKSHVQFNKHIWQPMVVDVGCGSGVGSNVLSQEASFVWGIDKNKRSIMFAKEAFERPKNMIYYSPQVTFDNIDVVQDTRDFQKFDVIVAIEIIEHVADYKTFLTALTGKLAKPDATFFISSPNRNNKSIQKDKPKNPYHVREWTSEEYHAVLSEFFNEVHFMSAAGEPTDIHTEHTPLLAMCQGIK